MNQLDKKSEESIEKSILKPLSNPVKIFARIRVEEFFYAQIISNLLSNLVNNENMQEFGYTQQQVLSIQNTWSDLIQKSNKIIKFQIEAKINERLLTKKEYYDFTSDISRMSLGLKKFVKEHEEAMLLIECEKYLEEQRGVFLDMNSAHYSK